MAKKWKPLERNWISLAIEKNAIRTNYINAKIDNMKRKSSIDYEETKKKHDKRMQQISTKGVL